MAIAIGLKTKARLPLLFLFLLVIPLVLADKNPPKNNHNNKHHGYKNNRPTKTFNLNQPNITFPFGKYKNLTVPWSAFLFKTIFFALAASVGKKKREAIEPYDLTDALNDYLKTTQADQVLDSEFEILEESEDEMALDDDRDEHEMEEMLQQMDISNQHVGDDQEMNDPLLGKTDDVTACAKLIICRFLSGYSKDQLGITERMKGEKEVSPKFPLLDSNFLMAVDKYHQSDCQKTFPCRKEDMEKLLVDD